VGRASSTNEKGNAYRIMMGKLDVMIKLEETTRRMDNIKMDHRRTGRSSMDWVDPAQYRNQRRALVNAVMNIRISQNAH
jgi:hypothetical protein